MNNSIYLRDICLIENPNDYKIHFGRTSNGTRPLDEWVRDPEIWKGWQRAYRKYNPYNRNYNFSTMQLENDVWLFGGIFRVCNQPEDEDFDGEYKVELTDQLESYIGRLILGANAPNRPARLNLEKHYNSLEVLEILRKPYPS